MLTGLELAVAISALLAQEPDDSSEEPKAARVPYTITVTAVSQALHEKPAFTTFKERLKKAMPHLELAGCIAVSSAKEGLEDWKFSGDAKVKFEPDKLKKLFLDIKIQRMQIEIEGEAGSSDKGVELTCHYSGWKVRLVNRKRRPGEKQEPEDLLDQIRRRVSEGQVHFRIRGDVVGTAGAYALEVEECFNVGAPKPPEKKK